MRLELLERPLLLLSLLLLRPLLLLRDDPSLRFPPRSRLLSDWLRDWLLLPRDELPDPDDLFDWFAMALLLSVFDVRRVAQTIRQRLRRFVSRLHTECGIRGNPCPARDSE